MKKRKETCLNSGLTFCELTFQNSYLRHLQNLRTPFAPYFRVPSRRLKNAASAASIGALVRINS